VRAVAERLVATGFAAAKIHGLGFSGAVFNWREFAFGLMRTVAQGLLLAEATGTPPIIFALLNCDGKWGISSAYGGGHQWCPSQFANMTEF